MAHAQAQQDPFGSAENVNQGGKDKRGKDRGNSGTRPIQVFEYNTLQCTLSTKHNATIVWSYFMQNLSLQKPTEKSMCYF